MTLLNTLNVIILRWLLIIAN